MNNFIPCIRVKHLSLNSKGEGFIKEVKDKDLLIITDNGEEVLIPKNESKTFSNSEFDYVRHYGYSKLKTEVKPRLEKFFPEDSRVMLRQMNDKFAPPIGTCGTVKGVEDMASLCITWDTGSTLKVVFGEDIVEKI